MIESFTWGVPSMDTMSWLARKLDIPPPITRFELKEKFFKAAHSVFCYENELSVVWNDMDQVWELYEWTNNHLVDKSKWTNSKGCAVIMYKCSGSLPSTLMQNWLQNQDGFTAVCNLSFYGVCCLDSSDGFRVLFHSEIKRRQPQPEFVVSASCQLSRQFDDELESNLQQLLDHDTLKALQITEQIKITIKGLFSSVYR